MAMTKTAEKEAHKIRVRERYERLKAEGICTNCGRVKAREGLTMCEVCAAAKAAIKRGEPINKAMEKIHGLSEWFAAHPELRRPKETQGDWLERSFVNPILSVDFKGNVLIDRLNEVGKYHVVTGITK